MDKESNISGGGVEAGRDVNVDEDSTVAGRDVNRETRQHVDIDAHFHVPHTAPHSAPQASSRASHEELPGTGPLEDAQAIIDELLSLDRDGGLGLDEYLRLRRQHSSHRRLISDAMLIEVARRQRRIEQRLNHALRALIVLFGLSPVIFALIAALVHVALAK
jgi:hypothetical protein